MSQLSTDPPDIEMTSAESLPITIDFSANLAGETITSAVVTLTNLRTATAYPQGLGLLTHTQTTVTQVVKGLQAGIRYRLAVAATTSGGNVWGSETEVRCVF